MVLLLTITSRLSIETINQMQSDFSVWDKTSFIGHLDVLSLTLPDKIKDGWSFTSVVRNLISLMLAWNFLKQHNKS